MRPTIFWFRRDLRLRDNPALVEAVRTGDGYVAAVFVVDPVFMAPAGPTRATYLRATLDALSESLGGRLIIRYGDPVAELASLAHEIGANEIFATGDFGPKGLLRDQRAKEVWSAMGLNSYFVDSPYVVAPGSVTTKTGTPCRVYTAFRRGWEAGVIPEPANEPEGVRWLEGQSQGLDDVVGHSGVHRPAYFGDLPDEPPENLMDAGEVAAHRRLGEFRANVDQYGELRNFPAMDGTSRLSPFLRFGALHPRQVLHAMSGTSTGRRTFESEICWREFYADVLFHNPGSVRDVLQPTMAHLRVDIDDRAIERFRDWAMGQTGYPLVDAGMRQLLAEGWMHNRVRMVAASFLVKHLHLDWRWGARWFMWRLIDGDVASNQHGWQWTAGTGTDAAPFHRIFNPTLQAERFDPDGEYVRQYVPELSHVSAPTCLQPGAGQGLFGATYRAPIVDASIERHEALTRFALARESAAVSS